jgi:NADH-quinone oxidoreductase subunit L
MKRKALPIPETTFLFGFSYNEWYIDKLYNIAIVNPVLELSKTARWIDINIIDGFIHLLTNIGLASAKIAEWTDRYIIDGLLHLIASIVMAIGNFARRFQNGKVQYYLFSMLAVILAIIVFKTIF